MPERHPAGVSQVSSATIVRISLITGAFVVLGLLLWQLLHVLLLGFGAILFAIILRSLAQVIERYTPVSGAWSLALTALLLAGLFFCFFLLLGLQIKSQFSSLLERAPEILQATSERLGIENLEARLRRSFEGFTANGGWMTRLAGFTTTVFDAIAGLLLVIVAGGYLAADSRRYRQGALELVPRKYQQEAEETLHHTGKALKLWLVGQLVIMSVVGVVTTLGLMLIGIPSALALGFLAGVAEFVPIVGPILSAIPAILIAFSEGGSDVYWVIALYVAIQQLESYVFMPLIQRWAIDLPPVLTLFAILALGMLFGPVGVLLSTPIAVTAYVIVKQLFVREALHRDTTVPGEDR